MGGIAVHRRSVPDARGLRSGGPGRADDHRVWRGTYSRYGAVMVEGLLLMGMGVGLSLRDKSSTRDVELGNLIIAGFSVAAIGTLTRRS